MSLLVPPDKACDDAYAQIAAIARAHALVISASSGIMTIATPDAQRVGDIREKVLMMHCMVEVEEGENRDIALTPQWPKRKPQAAYKPQAQSVDDINLTAFEEE